MYRKAKPVEWCQCCQQRLAFTDSHCSSNFFGNNNPSQIIDSSNNSCCFHIYKNLLALQSPTVSICKTRRFILYLCTLKNNPLLCSYLIRQINVFRLLRIHYFYYFVCPTTLQNIKNIFIGIFYHKFCLCFLQYSHSSNDKSESRGIHKIEL